MTAATIPARPCRASAESGFSFLEVMIAMGVLIFGSFQILGLFAIGVDRMVDRRVAARTEQMRPEIDSILQTAVNTAGANKLPDPITREDPRPLSRRGYALAVTWRSNPFSSPGLMAHAELLYQGQPVNVLIMPVRRDFLDPTELKDEAAGQGP